MEDRTFILELFMQDDQKQPLPTGANNNLSLLKPPLLQDLQPFLEFHKEVIKLEKTILKMLKNNIKSLGLESVSLPRTGTTFALYGG